MGVVQIGTGFVGRASPYDDSMENGKGRGRSETVVVEYSRCAASAEGLLVVRSGREGGSRSVGSWWSVRVWRECGGGSGGMGGKTSAPVSRANQDSSNSSGARMPQHMSWHI